jgi:hypothetical protein
MSDFRENLLRARSHIVFVLGLLAATAVILTLESRATAADCPPEAGAADRLAAPLSVTPPLAGSPS